ncbi:helix-turn-helix transcriptional regulator [bacterium]|nr:helix-turn-helix transcriptional regulator [bacterium]
MPSEKKAVDPSERELLLLGLLRNRHMHGYQLSEFLEAHFGMFFDLKKGTAYNLLGKMEKVGWVTSREEKEGRRPVRRVFAITQEGESIFQSLLRRSLREYRCPAFPANVPVLFLDALPQGEKTDLLEGRREEVKDQLRALETHVEHPLLDHRRRILQAELDWLDTLTRGAE